MTGASAPSSTSGATACAKASTARSGAGTRSRPTSAASAAASRTLRPDFVPKKRCSWSCSERPRCAGCCWKVCSSPSSPSRATTSMTASVPERADQLVLEVVVAHEEAQGAQVRRRVSTSWPRRRSARAKNRISPPSHSPATVTPSYVVEVLADVGDPAHGDHAHLGRGEAEPATDHVEHRGVAGSLDEDDAARRFGHKPRSSRVRARQRQRSIGLRTVRSPRPVLGSGA